jgi:hypothetical protein
MVVAHSGPSGSFVVGNPFLYYEGASTYLLDLIDPEDPLLPELAALENGLFVSNINDRGQMVASYGHRSFVLTPSKPLALVPSPGTGSLLAGALVCLAAGAWRRGSSAGSGGHRPCRGSSWLDAMNRQPGTN